ncbi:MAG TPA: hypothetical protein VF281_04830 [Candidatus Saccharimonadales bacterium]
MGLFQGKHQAKKDSPSDEVLETVHEMFDDHYREELRKTGQEYFERVISESAVRFKQDLDETIVSVNNDLKDYMTKRLDATIAHVDEELTKRLDERLAEYDKVTKDAQDQAVQSLNRNAHTLHDKYQQLATTLQQSMASQEAMMIGVFEENKARMIKTQGAQEMVLQSLQTSAQSSQQQSQQINASLEKTIADQSALLVKVFKDNEARIAATKEAQDAALQTLNASAQALGQQYQQLSATLQQSVADQKTLLVGAFESNMAQVIEHYLLGALGDQYDMKAQLPMIIKQMETNKQEIMDDMKL